MGSFAFKKSACTPEVAALYRSESTRARDFRKMEDEDLILINKLDKEDEMFIEPNYGILERLRYKV